MNQRLKSFLEKVSKAEDLKKAFSACKNLEEAIGLAKKHGFELKKEDFQEVVPEETKQAVDSDELNAVAGGSKCGCGIGGGGGSSGSEETCVCVVSGIGFVDVDGESLPRCMCVAAGAGSDHPI